MAKLIDLTGKRFGALTVMARDPDDKDRVTWICRCDCGRECKALGYNLTHGRVTSCGCGIIRNSRLKGKGGAKVDYTGQTFGQLTAVQYVSHGKWLWRCSCGGQTIAVPANVKQGKPSSCGCGLRASARARASDPNIFGYYDGTSVSAIKAITAGKIRSTNTSGCTGVKIRHNVASVTYQAYIMVRGKHINLGTYKNIDDAITARKDAERKYFGDIIARYDLEQSQKEGDDDK